MRAGVTVSCAMNRQGDFEKASKEGRVTVAQGEPRRQGGFGSEERKGGARKQKSRMRSYWKCRTMLT